MNASPVKTQSSWVRSRRSLVQRIVEQIHLRFGEESQQIKKYRKQYERDLSRPWRISRWPDLLKAVAQAEFVFGGDFHAFSQSARSHLRVLRQLPPSRSVTLALEALNQSQQQLVEKWLRGEVAREEFTAKLQWHKSWGFPLEITWPLLELARERGWKLLALSPPRSEGLEDLSDRDRYAAKALADSSRKNGHLHYVLFGDLHIARPHLPRQLAKLLPRAASKMVSLYVNPEGVYFRLAKKGLHNQVDVVRFNKKHFAILSSPPWVKWQSYLMYLEENYDLGIHDFDAGVDHTEHVLSLIQMIAGDLGLENLKPDIHVYSAQDDGIEALLAHHLEGGNLTLSQELIRSNRSLYLPEKNFFYLAQPTVNHAATLAGQYLHAHLSGYKKPFWNFPKDFGVLTWLEACGYFLSKLVNARRKPLGLHDLRGQVEVFQSRTLSQEALHLALDQSFRSLVERRGGKALPRAFESDHPMVYIAVSSFLGAKLGERIFESVQNHDLSLSHLVQLMQMDPRELVHNSVSYQALLEVTDRITPPRPKRMRS